MNLHQALVFAILMQHGRGVINKSETYIQEKLKAVQREHHDPLALLDHEGKELYARWYAHWLPGSAEALADIKLIIPKDPGG